jgi:hypothetical protein
MSYGIAGIDVHKKMLAVVVSDVEVDGEYRFERRMFGSNPAATPNNYEPWPHGSGAGLQGLAWLATLTKLISLASRANSPITKNSVPWLSVGTCSPETVRRVQYRNSGQSSCRRPTRTAVSECRAQ